MPMRAVYFDIGETLVDRTREYAAIARQLGVSPHTFSAVFGADDRAGGGVDDVARPLRRHPRGRPRSRRVPIAEVDLYPDARAMPAAPAGRGLQGRHRRQPAGRRRRRTARARPARRRDRDLGRVGRQQARPVLLRAGDRLGRRSAPTRSSTSAIRSTTTSSPALAAGLQAIRILRGPWGALVRDAAVESRCLAVVDTLTEIADRANRLLSRRGWPLTRREERQIDGRRRRHSPRPAPPSATRGRARHRARRRPRRRTSRPTRSSSPRCRRRLRYESPTQPL